jgi:hypothetical protein
MEIEELQISSLERIQERLEDEISQVDTLIQKYQEAVYNAQLGIRQERQRQDLLKSELEKITSSCNSQEDTSPPDQNNQERDLLILIESMWKDVVIHPTVEDANRSYECDDVFDLFYRGKVEGAAVYIDTDGSVAVFSHSFMGVVRDYLEEYRPSAKGIHRQDPLVAHFLKDLAVGTFS